MTPFTHGQVANPSGRPPLNERERRVPLPARVAHKTLAWLKREAAKRGISLGAIVDELVAARRKH